MNEAELELKKRCGGFSREALIALSSYHWPGNVRELRNVIRQAILLCDTDAPVHPRHMTFSSHVMRAVREPNPLVSEQIYDGKMSLKEIVASYVGAVEKRLIEEAMFQSQGNKSSVARNLKMDYKTLLRKIKAYGIR